MGLRIGKGKISRYDVRREDRNSLWFYIQNGGTFSGLRKVDSFDSYLIPSDFEWALTLCDVFYGCSSLKSICKINAPLAADCFRMFYGCEALTSVEVDAPSSAGYAYAFQNCTHLKSVVISGTDKVERFEFMLYGDHDLEMVSDLDLSSATNTSYMFGDCYSLRSVNLVNMSSTVTDPRGMFYSCHAMESIPKGLVLDGAINVGYMFYNCYNLKSVALSAPSATDMRYMFYNCYNLESVALSAPSATDVRYMFYCCWKLKSVPALDASKMTNLDKMFSGCSSLEEIHMTGMKVSFSVSASTKFTREALVEIIGNLAEVTSTKTLTMGSTNLAKLTDDDKAVATGKGWTLE